MLLGEGLNNRNVTFVTAGAVPQEVHKAVQQRLALALVHSCLLVYVVLFSVTGIGSQFSRKRQVRDGWQGGDILGALLDFDKREIQYFRNGKWNETLKLHPESKRLWAMANMFELGNAVRLRLKAVGGRPPE
ncbi:hypothetical protein QOT17_003052 [Balamuthia mandrillaris]